MEKGDRHLFNPKKGTGIFTPALLNPIKDSA
jgi:hypothetical protein